MSLPEESMCLDEGRPQKLSLQWGEGGLHVLASAVGLNRPAWLSCVWLAFSSFLSSASLASTWYWSLGGAPPMSRCGTYGLGLRTPVRLLMQLREEGLRVWGHGCPSLLHTCNPWTLQPPTPPTFACLPACPGWSGWLRGPMSTGDWEVPRGCESLHPRLLWERGARVMQSPGAPVRPGLGRGTKGLFWVWGGQPRTLSLVPFCSG